MVAPSPLFNFASILSFTGSVFSLATQPPDLNAWQIQRPATTPPIADGSRRRIAAGLLGIASGGAAVVTIPSPSRADAQSFCEIPATTDEVRLRVRISRSDGTFYDKTGEGGDTPGDSVFSASLRIGLFGTSAPIHAQQFLKYIDGGEVSGTSVAVGEDDEPFPSYGSSSFKSYDDALGILEGGSISGLSAESFGGAPALRYGRRLIPATLWLEKNGNNMSGTCPPGMLVHRTLDVLPTFGVTVRPTTVRDGKIVGSRDETIVFGRVTIDGDAENFFSAASALPTYSVERPTYSDEGGITQTVAANVFNNQRDFMRNFAGAIGDTRLSKVYNGKLLRRVEVTEAVRVKQELGASILD